MLTITEIFSPARFVPLALKQTKFAKFAYNLYDEYITHLPLKLYYWKEALLVKKKQKAVLFYPEMPAYNYVLYNICKYSGYKIVNLQEKADYVIYFHDTTYRTADQIIKSLQRKQEVINYNCRDISKKNVDRIQLEVFRYSLEVNPMTYKGAYLKKGNLNSSFKGAVIERPEKPMKNFVYQKVVKNTENGFACDIRVPVFKNIIPFVYLIYSREKNRFGDDYSKLEIAKATSVFSDKELKDILKFCRIIGLDYGELDVLRDNETKRIYIVDANNTPVLPTQHISFKKKLEILNLLSKAFSSAFLSGIVSLYGFSMELMHYNWQITY